VRSFILSVDPGISVPQNKRPVLPLYHTILMWCVGSGELVLDAFLLKILLHLQILELGPVVASYLFHLELKFVLSPP
jgi:hypothetical protein